MPLPISKYGLLSETKKGPRGQRHTEKSTLDLSEKCPILPNWMTDRQGHCERNCQYRHATIMRQGVEKRCPARG